jgi:hypothetical protein
MSSLHPVSQVLVLDRPKTNEGGNKTSISRYWAKDVRNALADGVNLARITPNARNRSAK